MSAAAYIPNTTQEGRLLNLLKERGDRGAFVYEFTSVEFMRPRGGAVMQYNSRLWGVRRKLGCSCHVSTSSCSASEHIINTTPGHFLYKTSKNIPEYIFLENGQGAFI